MKLTDDECITTAMLSGCPIEQSTLGNWFAGLEGAYHPIEEANSVTAGNHGFKTRAELCRAWCRYYNLGE